MMQVESHLFQGLRRDNHQIKQDSKYLWDAHNIRLTNRDHNTLLSLTNEKGTLDTGVSFEGEYVGHCVLGKYLVVFTAETDKSNAHIYRLEKTDTGYKKIILFRKKEVWENSWDPKYPIESIGVYETELVQKIYWVDSVNQPRVINIAKPELKLTNTITIDGTIISIEELIVDGVNLSGNSYSESLGGNYYHPNPEYDQILQDNFPDGLYQTNSFDFVKELELQDVINAEKRYGEGEFSPGVIQYAISYFNKYEQESNISCITPLYYISPKNRGGSPEEKVNCNFKLDIDFPDKNFEYIRLYSIHRTSIDSVPSVKIVEDIPITSKNSITFIDTGIKGSALDPSQLLYIGGESLVANCITHKDGTLFLGNISITKGNKITEIEALIKDNWSFDKFMIREDSVEKDSTGSYYSYTPNLDNKYSGRFKYGETYRCGVQVQFKDGKWSSPIFIDDTILQENPIWDSGLIRNIKSIRINSTDSTDITVQQKLSDLGVRRLRACVVFPKFQERDIICQGILCPTVFRVADRKSGAPYTTSSWFFRPAYDNESNDTGTPAISKGSSIEFKHNYALFTGDNFGAEVQNMLAGANTLDTLTENIGKYKSHIFVDENVITFHSPDIEFDTSISNADLSNVKLSIIGVAKLGAISGDISIQTSTPSIGYGSEGFLHNIRGYKLGEVNNINGGLISTPNYSDLIVSKEFKPLTEYRSWMVYPWHRSGSLNNDSKRTVNEASEGGTRSAELQRKVISNLKFFSENISIESLLDYSISTPQLFNSNEISINKFKILHLNSEVVYQGNVDTLNIGEEYPIYGYNEITKKIDSLPEDAITTSIDPVRIKYKSSPHIVLSLFNNVDNDEDNTKVQLLPRWGLMEDTILNGDQYTIPNWETTFEAPDSSDSTNILYLYSYSEYLGESFVPAPEEGHAAYAIMNGYLYTSTGTEEPSWEKPNTGIPMDPIVLKAIGTKCILNNNFLPGTKESDYEIAKGYSTYIGSPIYYTIYTDSDRRIYKIEYGSGGGGTRPAKVKGTTSNYTLSQDTFSIENQTASFPYMLIGELRRVKSITDKFGGKSTEALKQNLWIPAGRTYNIYEEGSISEGDITIPFEYGDTWYSRYDCLKTYPFTMEDENSVVEIGSFMCETRVNIDGRYDKNRGQFSNLTMTPQNFNLINEVYTQKDNFFNYRILDSDYYKQNKFSNQITWSKEKHAGEDIDTWTNITLASTLDMNGSKGNITSLTTWNDILLCFQEKEVSKINFNSRVQIPVSDGVPIEISNGYKVDGSTTLNSNIGCINKWSINNSLYGVYFIDSYTDNIYLFNGEFANLSNVKGVKWWSKEHSNNIWSPINNNTTNGIRTFIDSIYGDIYFSPGPSDNQEDALYYSEQLGEFVSQMSYGGVQAMFNFDNEFYSLHNTKGTLKLYQNNAGPYNYFYNGYKGWDFSFISNDNPLFTKVFDTIELRTDHYDKDDTLLNDCPLSYIQASNEYQDSDKVILDSRNMRKKFRVWRGLIPRNNGTRERIRNPWTMITLGWNVNPTKDEMEANLFNNKRAIVHDVTVKYTV